MAITTSIKGRISRSEFRMPYRQCCELLTQLGIQYHDGAGDAGLFLFFQSYPNEFPHSYLMQLRRNNPLSPFFFILGVCCEGMLRTAGQIDSPFYVYTHAWSGRELEQIRLFLTGQPSLFSLPITAGDDEIAIWYAKEERNRHTETLPSEGATSPACLILSRFGPFGNDSAMNQLLAEEQRRRGVEPVFSGGTLPDAFSGIILADADNSPKEKILESIQSLRRRLADNDFTVYIDSPRIDEKTDYTQSGATRILPKRS